MIKIYSEKPIAIIRDRKSAAAGNTIIPKYDWISTKDILSMESIQGNDVTLFPPLGEYDEWLKVAAKHHFKISRLIEDVATEEDRRKGLDAIDFILK